MDYAFIADLDGGEVLVELRVQGGQLIDGAVESAVVVTEDLTQEERGKRNIHNYALYKKVLQLNIHENEQRARTTNAHFRHSVPHKQLFRASSPQTQRAASDFRGCTTWAKDTAFHFHWWSA